MPTMMLSRCNFTSHTVAFLGNVVGEIDSKGDYDITDLLEGLS